MEEAEFIIPHSLDELLEYNDKQYSVQDVLEPVEIRDQYTGLRLTLDEDLNDFIFGKFDLLYSVIKNFQLLTPKVTYEVWELVLKAFGLQISNLKPFLEKGNLDDSLRVKLLRNTKMIFYICTELMYKFEERALIEKETTTSKGAKGKKKAAEKKKEWDWDDEKTESIRELYGLISLDLKKLWKQTNITDDFLDQISRICLKLLEDREIGFAAKSSMRNSIFQIISVLCKEFIFGLSLIPRLIQMLMLHEHLAAPLASSISSLEADGNTGLLQLILEDAKQDENITPKAGSNFAEFLVCLSKENPESLSKQIEHLSDLLQKDPYTMRNGVLETVGNLIFSLYIDKELSPEQTNDRDALFGSLEDHLLDLNAFCRCKAMQAWTTLVLAEKLPVRLFLQIIEQIVEHTIDKSSYCRRDAIKFMKACLEHNPFAGNLDQAKISKSLEVHVEKLKNFEARHGLDNLDVEDVWESVEQQVQVVTAQYLAKELTEGKKKDVQEDEEKENKVVNEEEMEVDGSEKENVDTEKEEEPKDTEAEQQGLLKEGLVRVANLLVAKKLEEAVTMAFDLTKKYDTKNFFGLLQQEEEDEEDDDIDSKILQKTDYMCTLMKAALQSIRKDNAAPTSNEEVEQEVKRQKDYIRFLKNCLKFSGLVHLASNNVLKILPICTTTDLVEAIDFIASAQQFGILSEEDSVLKLLEFLHSKDLNLKKSVSEACKKIYLSSIDPAINDVITHDNYLEAMKMACSLVHKANPNFHSSLSLLIQNWVAEKDFNDECFFTLWELVESRNKSDCVPALHLLSIALAGRPATVQKHIETLDTIGFGSRGEGCFELVSWAARVLALATPKVTAEMLANPFRLHIDHQVYNHMTNLIIKGMFKLSDNDYCIMASSIVTAIFKTCKRPISLMSEIMKKMVDEVSNYQVTDNESHDEDPSQEPRPLTQICTQNPDSQHPSSQRSQPSSPSDKTPQVILMRFVHVVGQVAEAMHWFVYEDVMSEIRRQKHLLDLEKGRRKQARQSRVSQARKSVESSMVTEDDDEGPLFDVIKLLRGSSKHFVSNTEEENLDRLLRLCDKEVLSTKGVLGILLPYVQDCFTSSRCSHHGMRVTAILAFGKYMKLSPNFCTEHLRKFVTMLSRGRDMRVKIACIHTLADLLKKYPNQCEPYSPHLYECLKDENDTVRLEALVVISKLILSDMLRVKFQITSLALCLTDENQNCKDIANYFFATLATKGNILYNLLLDMISQLSAEYTETNQAHFEQIMKTVLPYIDKEKQVVALIEKLCSRFKDKEEEIECYNLALCISHLHISAKSIKAVKDGLEFYADKLKFPKVKQQFDDLLNSARKQLKTEGKEVFDQWQDLLDACAQDKEAAKKAVAALAENAEAEQVEKKAKRKPPAKSKGAKRKPRQDSSEEDDEPKTPQQRGKRGGGRRPPPPDSDSDDDLVLKTAARHKRPPPEQQRPARSSRRPVRFDSDSE